MKDILRYSLLGTCIVIILLMLSIFIAGSPYKVRPVPDFEPDVDNPVAKNPVKILANDGKTQICSQYINREELKNLSDFSPYLIQALIAAEDSRYDWHIGVDPMAVFRAGLANIQAGKTEQGGSTITQQLARSIYRDRVGREAKGNRKVKEAIAALKLEFFYSKDEILKLYLNRVFLGRNNYGFEAAAQFYFNKSAAFLNIQEAATLVASLTAPNAFKPEQDVDQTKEQRDAVIERMAVLDMINDEERKKALRSRIKISPQASTVDKVHYFCDYIVNEELPLLMGENLAEEGNFIIETSLDLELQQKAEKSLRESIANDGDRLGFSQGGIVTLDRIGGIAAMAGGVDYKQNKFNHVTQAQRQAGSTFKVFIYAAALERGISPYRYISCNGLSWQGQYYNGCERSGGREAVTLFEGLAQSENVVALRLAKDIGLTKVAEMAKLLGISSNLEPLIPGVVLGQKEVNLLEMTGAYATFANDGVWNRPHGIVRILDLSTCSDRNDPATCEVLYNDEDEAVYRYALGSQVYNTMTRLLRGVVTEGTGRNAALGWGEVGKTGTTDKAADLWFIGYIPDRRLTTGVWLGNQNNTSTQGSSRQAAKLWANYMRKVVQ